MEVREASIPGVLIIQAHYRDNEPDSARGWLKETYRFDVLGEYGVPRIDQCNKIKPRKGELRGMHYQLEPYTQPKLIEVSGRVFDVFVDMRLDSPTFGKWEGIELSEDNGLQLYLPAGIAHGFYALEDSYFWYAFSNYYNPDAQRSIRWDDPDLNIQWPFEKGFQPILSEKDARALLFQQAKAELVALQQKEVSQ